MTDQETNPPPKRVECWGCECEVPLKDGKHVEPTDMAGTFYVYPCKKPKEPKPCP